MDSTGKPRVSLREFQQAVRGTRRAQIVLKTSMWGGESNRKNRLQFSKNGLNEGARALAGTVNSESSIACSCVPQHNRVASGQGMPAADRDTQETDAGRTRIGESGSCKMSSSVDRGDLFRTTHGLRVSPEQKSEMATVKTEIYGVAGTGISPYMRRALGEPGIRVFEFRYLIPRSGGLKEVTNEDFESDAE
ncbi:hypothetical protein C8R44DRAFT_725859 [Mycena epipterygia]|nr:hypothetical protein C8R44DRAFT_725859 [Mycena epipterygia]